MVLFVTETAIFWTLRVCGLRAGLTSNPGRAEPVIRYMQLAGGGASRLCGETADAPQLRNSSLKMAPILGRTHLETALSKSSPRLEMCPVEVARPHGYSTFIDSSKESASR